MPASIEVKKKIHDMLFFPSPNFFVRLESPFLRPTRSVQSLSRAGAVKVGRRSDLSSYAGDARPHLDSSEHDSTLVVVGDDDVEGSSLVAHGPSCRNLVFGGS